MTFQAVPGPVEHTIRELRPRAIEPCNRWGDPWSPRHAFGLAELIGMRGSLPTLSPSLSQDRSRASPMLGPFVGRLRARPRHMAHTVG